MFKNEIFSESEVKRNIRHKKRAMQTFKWLTLTVRAKYLVGSLNYVKINCSQIQPTVLSHITSKFVSISER